MLRKIKKIRLMNFQIHKSFILEDIDEGMIALVGQSSSGKTAVLRAIKFCLYNQMPGNSVAATVTHGEHRVEVEITFNDGLSITRVRDIKNKDNYYLIERDGETTRLDTPGAGPVKEVILAHGMRPISFLTNKDILNYSSQHDAPFFINATPQERLRAIGTLSNTEVADAGIKLAASQVRENKKTASALRKELAEKNARLKEIGPLKQRKARLERVKGLIKTIQDLENKQEELESLTEAISRMQGKISDLDKVLAEEEAQNLAETCVEKVIQSTEKLTEINKIRSAIISAETKIKDADDTLSVAPSDEEIENLLEDISLYLKLIDDIDRISDIKYAISQMTRGIKKADESIRQAEKVSEAESSLDDVIRYSQRLKELSVAKNNISTAKRRFEENERMEDSALSEYNDAVDKLIHAFDDAGVCPLCESELTENSAKKIVKEYELT